MRKDFKPWTNLLSTTMFPAHWDIGPRSEVGCAEGNRMSNMLFDVRQRIGSEVRNELQSVQKRRQGS